MTAEFESDASPLRPKSIAYFQSIKNSLQRAASVPVIAISKYIYHTSFNPENYQRSIKISHSLFKCLNVFGKHAQNLSVCDKNYTNSYINYLYEEFGKYILASIQYKVIVYYYY